MPDAPSQPRAIVYTRVSTGAQADSGIGLEDQLATIQATANFKGWRIVHYASDAGLSGKQGKKRPGLEEALKMLEAGEADILVASKLDRLSRSVVDFTQIVQRAKKQEWAVVVLDLDVDMTTAVGGLMAAVISAMAEFESQRIGERVKASHAVRRQRGQRAGQRPLLPDEIRQRIGEAAAAGKNPSTIARELNDQGVPTAKGGENGHWYPNTVRQVLQSLAKERALAEAAMAHQAGSADAVLDSSAA